RWTRGNVALLPRDISATDRAHVFKSHHLWSNVFVVETLDTVVEVVHFHLLHLPLGRGVFGTTGSCTCEWHSWPAVVLGETWPWDRGGLLAFECSSVTG
ncbi:hypothetical protein M959_06396, partial [Chaetura pelagica]